MRLRHRDGALRFEVEGDGRGFDPASQKKGSGTQNMEDRVDSLGGHLVIESSLGGGTVVRGALVTADVVRYAYAVDRT